jgi:Fe-S cluster assembly iron-binding protein IscA
MSNLIDNGYHNNEVMTLNIQTNGETIQEFKRILESKEGRPHSIRIFISGMGCSGPKFGLVLDPQKEGDLVYEEGGVSFLVEPDIHEAFGDFLVDFQQDGFVVKPMLEQESGCGGCGGSCSS